MAGITNLLIDQGADFNVTVTLEDADSVAINLTGYTGKSLMRRSFYSGLNVYAITVVIPNPATSGNIQLSMPASTSVNIPPGRYSYDVIITNGTLTTKVLQGIIVVNPSSTNFDISVNIGATGATGIGPSAYYGSTSYVYWKYDSTLHALGATSVMPGV
jgi:hypothetical protein